MTNATDLQLLRLSLVEGWFFIRDFSGVQRASLDPFRAFRGHFSSAPHSISPDQTSFKYPYTPNLNVRPLMHTKDCDIKFWSNLILSYRPKVEPRCPLLPILSLKYMATSRVLRKWCWTTECPFHMISYLIFLIIIILEHVPLNYKYKTYSQIKPHLFNQQLEHLYCL